MLRLTRSIEVDIRLLPHDLSATRAHARMLAAAGILREEEVADVERACAEILAGSASGSLSPDDVDEDVHSFVERELTARLGETGAKIHAARSRNDLVAQDLRMWCADASDALRLRVVELIDVLAAKAEQHVDTAMPGYTHLQRAQPVSVGFHLIAHATALTRDLDRLASARASSRTCVLGAGALAGTTLPVDPGVAAADLGIPALFLNAMDAVADRDFACDLVYACALCGVHLSRLAEDVIVFSSVEFGFFKLSDAWSTGSSIMPQKRNPDVAEIARGRAASGIGDLVSMLSLLKGLPLAYDRDLQQDKEHVFASVDRLATCLEGMTHLMHSITVDGHATTLAAGDRSLWATDAAEQLVLQGVPFRHAHTRIGRDVARAERGEIAAPDVEASLGARKSHGGTAAPRVRDQIEAIRRIADSHRIPAR